MWIRGQNGQTLVQATDLNIKPLSSRHISTTRVEVVSGNFIVAEYESMEEAKVVLDIIFEYLDLKNKVVFTMPQRGEKL